ncbi:hypothetical protein L2E82_08416 [Cichorium intybus]|uniref:Uncharacterized protein n=1 Tax=Cichorium intybus TaxID=13427 RepID=A0ACB9G719_CICIN|nr:hypothetical protein L2E82_08416 [Cichorium intybus]
MAREWKLLAEEGGGGNIYGGFQNHAIIVFWVALLTFSIITTLIFSCADGASKHNAHPENHAAACGGGCGGGCGG